MSDDLLGRIRAQVMALGEPSALLALYTDPSGRAALRERVRALAPIPLDEPALDEICSNLFGFGPLQPFLEDPAVTDVLVNGPGQVYVERAGRLELTTARFADVSELSDLVYRIAASVGRELTVEQPFVNARMRDGSRANAVVEPVGGPTLSIRRFGRFSLSLDGPSPSWSADSALAPAAVDLLRVLVEARANLVVSGPTGSGKSTLLRSLAALIPTSERLIVIEDTNELRLEHPHVVHLECVPGADTGAVPVADLVVNALRMRPDRIIVGEVRTPRDASALLEALSTGHRGALTTLHAGSAEDALWRLELLLARAGDLAASAVERHIRRAIEGVVHLARDRDGRRSVQEIAQVTVGRFEVLWRAGETSARPWRVGSRSI